MKINSTCTEIEKILNIAGSMPLTNFVSGSVRAVAGACQLAVAGIFTGAGIIGLGLTRGVEATGFAGPVNASEESTAFYITKNSSEHVMHGALNVIRGVGEVLLGWTKVPFVYQAASDNRFAPIFKYSE